MRIHKYMALSGVASRRKSEEIILEGRVKINGVLVTTMGIVVGEGDVVTVDDNVISIEETKRYIMLYKPLNCVTTADDQFNRQTVLDYITDVKERIYPVGRLDYNTTGLLLLTNDGDLANKITHPSTHLNKVYVAKIQGHLTQDEINQLKNGVMIEERLTSKAGVKVIKPDLIELTIHEGRNRQVRKMFEAIGHPVITLKRIAIGILSLDNLEIGQYRDLTLEEINYLKNYEVTHDSDF